MRLSLVLIVLVACAPAAPTDDSEIVWQFRVIKDHMTDENQCILGATLSTGHMIVLEKRGIVLVPQGTSAVRKLQVRVGDQPTLEERETGEPERTYGVVMLDPRTMHRAMTAGRIRVRMYLLNDEVEFVDVDLTPVRDSLLSLASQARCNSLSETR
jgi:hypothetical protein